MENQLTEEELTQLKNLEGDEKVGLLAKSLNSVITFMKGLPDMFKSMAAKHDDDDEGDPSDDDDDGGDEGDGDSTLNKSLNFDFLGEDYQDQPLIDADKLRRQLTKSITANVIKAHEAKFDKLEMMITALSGSVSEGNTLQKSIQEDLSVIGKTPKLQPKKAAPYSISGQIGDDGVITPAAIRLAAEAAVFHKSLGPADGFMITQSLRQNIAVPAELMAAIQQYLPKN